MTQPSPENDFAATRPAETRWHASPFLRRGVWLWALFFLILLNAWLAFCGNDFFSRLNLRSRPMDRSFGIAEENGWNAFRAWRRLDRGRHIVWLGDSVSFGGRTPAHKTFCALLEQRLRQNFPLEDISVDNFSVAGANPPEKLALLRQLNLPLETLLIVQLRPDEFAHGTTGLLASTPWLWKYAEPGSVTNAASTLQLAWMQWRQGNEEGLSSLASRWIPMIRHRERMNMFLFGGTDAGRTLVSRDRFRQAGWLKASWAERLTRNARSEAWKTGAWNEVRFQRYRTEHPFRMDDASTEYRCLERLLEHLKQERPDRSLVYLCPNNQLLLKTGLKESEYKSLVIDEEAWLRQRTSDFENLFHALGAEAFYDNFHLTDEGHRKMAERMLPLIERKIRELGWVGKEEVVR